MTKETAAIPPLRDRGATSRMPFADPRMAAPLPVAVPAEPSDCGRVLRGFLRVCADFARATRGQPHHQPAVRVGPITVLGSTKSYAYPTGGERQRSDAVAVAEAGDAGRHSSGAC